MFWQLVTLISEKNERLLIFMEARYHLSVIILVCFWSMRTSRIVMNIAFIDREKCSVRGLVLPLISLSLSERKFSLVKYGCPYSIYTWGS